MGLLDFLKNKKTPPKSNDSQKWYGMGLDNPVRRPDFGKAGAPIRTFSIGHRTAMYYKNVPAKDDSTELIKQVFVVMETSPVLNTPVYLSYPQVWITAQKLKNDSEHFLTLYLGYMKPPVDTVLSGESDRYISDDDYFIKNAMMAIFEINRSKNDPFVEYNESSPSSKKAIGEYHKLERDGNKYVVFLPPESDKQ